MVSDLLLHVKCLNLNMRRDKSNERHVTNDMLNIKIRQSASINCLLNCKFPVMSCSTRISLIRYNKLFDSHEHYSSTEDITRDQ